MASKQEKYAFRKCHTGGSNVEVVEIDTTGLDLNDTYTIKAGLNGAIVHSVKFKTTTLGNGTNIDIGTDKDADAFFDGTTTASTVQKEWIGRFEVGDDTFTDFVITFKGANPGDKTITLVVGYTHKL